MAKEISTKKDRKVLKQSIIGVLQLFAVASIAYSSIVIVMGTKGIIPLLLITPQALLGATIAVQKFSK